MRKKTASRWRLSAGPTWANRHCSIASLGKSAPIVSDVAGTTRDSIDAKIEIDDQCYTLIDTAGIRRKPKESAVVEKICCDSNGNGHRASRHLRAAFRQRRRVYLCKTSALLQRLKKLVRDASCFSTNGTRSRGYRMEHCQKAIKDDASFLAHCPMLFASALTGRNTEKLFDLIKTVHTDMQTRITTGQLNKFVERTIQAYSPPMIKGKRLRIYYLTQIKTQPPYFVLFVNHPDLMLETYRKYLLNAFRKAFCFAGCPVKFALRRHAQREDISKYVANR